MAPPIPGVALGEAPTALLFYKVTCPTCQMAAPATERFETAYPGRIVGIGQDPEEKLSAFARQYGVSYPTVEDLPPYPASTAYGVRVVPTVFLIGRDGAILDVVESWDREGFNRVSRRLAELTGADYLPISEEGDGLPTLRPG